MTTDNTKPLPKSLHTVTVLVRVARHLMREMEPKDALLSASLLLGYPVGTPDPHGLMDHAAKQLGVEL